LIRSTYGISRLGTVQFGGIPEIFSEKSILYGYLTPLFFIPAQFGIIRYGIKRFGETFGLLPEIDKQITYHITNVFQKEREILYSIAATIIEENDVIYSYDSLIGSEKNILYWYPITFQRERNIVYTYISHLGIEKDIIYGFTSYMSEEEFIVYNFSGQVFRGIVRNIKFDVSTGQLVATIELERM